MNVIRHTYFIYRRNLTVWLAQPAMVASPIITSVLMFWLFAAPLQGITNLPGFPANDYNAFLTGMIVVMSVVFSGADVAMALLTDIMSGYFDKLLLAPINRFSILLGTLLVAATRSLVQVLAIVTVALLLGVDFAGGFIGILVVIGAATVFGTAFSCIGVIVAVKTKNIQVTQTIWIAFMPVTFLTTAFMPREFLTGWFKHAVAANPVDYILIAIRTIIIDGWVWDEIWTGLWVLVAMTISLPLLATWFYRRATA